MSLSEWIIVLGGTAALTVLLWPASGTRWSMRGGVGSSVRSGSGVGGSVRSRRARLPAELPSAAAAAGATLASGLVVGHAAAAALCSVVCIAAMKVMLASRRWTATAEGVARLAGVLANQASVAVTAVDALRHAAPLVSGPVGDAAEEMAADAERLGMAPAAEHFAARVPSAAARSLANLLTVAAEGGGRWAQTVSVLEAEASEAAATARLFHARVAAAMPTLAIVTSLGAGLVAGSAWTARDVGAWLAGPQGAMLVLGGAVVIAALCARVLLPARALTRSDGRPR